MNTIESITDRVKELPPAQRLQLASILVAEGAIELGVLIAETTAIELRATQILTVARAELQP